MMRPVLYQVIDRTDGTFDLTATIMPDKTFTRAGLASLAEVNDVIDTLRTIMAACGVELVLDPASDAVAA